jgi:predicted Ser/Thr protein kinase
MQADTRGIRTFNVTNNGALSGKSIGKYDLQEVLGSGGMATVYRAIQQPLGRSVAFKVLHPHLTQQDSFRERFLREAKAIASLRHSHIVQMYDYDFKDGVCYIAMEFLDGKTLEDKLTRLRDQNQQTTPLPLNQALETVTMIARALDFAHKERVIHRDIKPANIIQTSDGRTVLTDFGIATILHETRLTVDGGTSGTPSYMSPEQALGERGDERSDIYSMGAVLYQLVTGYLPFEADTLYGLIMMHVNDTPPLASRVNPKVPQVVEQIILKAMAKNADDRYQTAAEFAADLESVVAGRAVTVELPVQTPPETGSPASRNWLWILPVAVTLLIIAAAAWLLFADEPEAPVAVAAAVGAEMPAVSVDASSSAGAIDEEPDFTRSMAAVPEYNQPMTDFFDDNTLEWPITDGPVVRGFVDGAYQISVEAPDRAVATIPEYLSIYDSFSYTVDASLVDGQPESGYGLIFHQQNSDNYHVFAVNGMRQWSIWRLKDGVWTELRNLPGGRAWTDDEIVNAPGEVNHLQLQASGNNFVGFINDKEMIRISDPEAAKNGGLVGIYVASSRTATEPLARVQIDNLELAPLDSDAVEFVTTDPKP